MNIQMTELMLTQKFNYAMCMCIQCDHKQLQKKWARYGIKLVISIIHTKQLVTSMLSVADKEHNSDIISQTE